MSCSDNLFIRVSNNYTFILVKCATASYDHKLGIGFLKSPNHLRTLKHVVVPEAYQDSPE